MLLLSRFQRTAIDTSPGGAFTPPFGHPGTPLPTTPLWPISGIRIRDIKNYFYYFDSLWTKQTPGYNRVMPLGRNYSREYSKYHSSARAKKDRAARNTARRRAIRAGLVRKGDAKDIDHKDGNPRNNAKGNLRVMSRGMNRGRNNNSWRR